MKSFNFQIVNVANLAAITTPFPDHICYFTEDLENYYIWENNALKEIFVDASSISWNNITNKPTTITGFGITDAVKVNNGTLNYISKFTPDGQTIGNSQIIDDDTSVGINVTPSITHKLRVKSSLNQTAIYGEAVNSGYVGVYGINYANGSGLNIGVIGEAQNSTGTNIGGQFNAIGNGAVTIGVQSIGTGTGNSTVVGLNAIAGGGTGSKYAVQLQDGTQGTAGWYLRNMTTDGKANWAKINITEVTNGLSSTLLGAPNGIATLDNNSKLTISQMPITVMDYKGTFNPTIPSPTLQDGVGNTGDVYAVTASGTYTFGPGNTLTLGVGDWVIYNGTKWEKTLGNNVGSGTVNSVGITLGTTGTDVSVSNSPITTSGNINLNIPSASASARGLLTANHWSLFNAKVDGSGTLNTIPKWTNSNTIGDSCIKENAAGQSISVGTTATPAFQTPFLTQTTGAHYLGGWFSNTHVYSGNKLGIIVDTQGNTSGRIVGIENRAGSQQGAPDNINIGIFTRLDLSSSSLRDYGLYVDSNVTNNTFENIGAYIKSANNGTGGKYSVQLIDGSEAAGKFLKSITVDGKANWANIQVSDVTGAVGGSGANQRIALWTGSSVVSSDPLYKYSTIAGDAAIELNGSANTVKLGSSSSGIRSTSYAQFSLESFNNNNHFPWVNVSYQRGTTAPLTPPITADVLGEYRFSGINLGAKIHAIASQNHVAGVSAGTDLIISTASNTSIIPQERLRVSNNGTIRFNQAYSFPVSAGTENQTFKVDSSGNVNWAYIPSEAQIMCSDLTTGITASAAPKAFWHAPCNGQFTDIVFYRRTASATMTVEVRKVSTGALVASVTFLNGNHGANTVTTSSFSRFDEFDIFVTATGDTNSKGLLATFNYNRT